MMLGVRNLLISKPSSRNFFDIVDIVTRLQLKLEIGGFATTHTGVDIPAKGVVMHNEQDLLLVELK